MEKIPLKILNFQRGIFLTAIFFLAISILNGCAPKRRVSVKYKRGTYRPYRVNGKTYYPLPSAYGFREEGYASWYGPGFHGKRTASGEPYNMYAMTAAHKILPMNTYVRVENLKNHRSVVVRINDRGPFVKNRIIDLSYAAAKRLGMIGDGTARVRIVALGEVKSHKDNVVTFEKVPDFLHGDFYVQVGAFLNPDNAYRLKWKLSQNFKTVRVKKAVTNGMLFFKVQVDAPDNLVKARRFERELENLGFYEAFLVAR